MHNLRICEGGVTFFYGETTKLRQNFTDIINIEISVP